MSAVGGHHPIVSGLLASWNRDWRALAICLLITSATFLVTRSPANAQTSSAQLTGMVIDSSGARLPGAQVTITSTSTGIAKSASTNDAGEYTFSFLTPGVYNVHATKDGFASAEETGITLNVGDVRSVTVTLKVGQTSETVTTVATAQLVNTENSEVSQVIGQRQVLDIPLNGRNFTQLVTLGEGAYSTTGGASSGFRPQLGNSDLGIAGGRYNSVQYLIDGMTNRDVGFGAPILFPSVEALQEFKEQAGTYSAQYGGSAQQVNINFRSGTDALHGSVFDFLRNQAMDARGFLAGATIPELHRNQFGYSLGGPVFIPHLYDGRGKTFFFANYEGLRQTAKNTGYLIVPDPTQLSGVFPSTIIDPTTGQPFPNNTIPADRISAFATEYRKHFLAPNTNSPNGNFFGSASTPIVSDQQNYRIDENLNHSNSIFFRYSWSEYRGTTGGLNSTGDSGQNIYHAGVRAYQGEWTKTISANVVNQARFGYIHTINDQNAPLIDKASFDALGIQGGYTDIAQFELPSISFTGTGISGGGTDLNFPTVDRTGIWDGSDALIITKGQHTINIGFGYRWWKRTDGKGANLGDVTFNGETTNNAVADFLLGLPQNYEFPQPTPLASSASQIAFNFPQFQLGPYIEDQWKASSRLSVNVGLRYDFYSISREGDGAWGWLDPTVTGGGLCIGTKKINTLGISNELEHYCGSRTPNGAPKIDLAPRIGLAFSPNADGRTAIRAGYGVFFDTPEENDDVNIANVYPFFSNGDYTTVPGVSQVDLSKPFPSITTLEPITTAQLGFIFSAPKKLPTYSSQWSLSVEREVGKNTRVTASYLGSHTVHLETRYFLNQPNYYDPANPQNIKDREPYQNFNELFGQSYGPGSTYNGGTIKVQHNARNLVLLSSFTWSRSMDIRSAAFGVGNDGSNGGGGWAGPMDSRNFNRDYARSSFDINKRFVVSFVYQLPVGRGQKFLTNAPRLLDAAVGGWQVNGIGSLQSGLPFSIYALDQGGVIDTFSQRADEVHNPVPAGLHRNAAHWFDTTAFAQPAIGVFGNTGRNILLQPYYDNWDLSLFKNFALFESVSLQLRGEAFNAVNHTNLGVPDTDLNSPTFGVISSSSGGRVLQVAGKVVW